MHIAGLSASDYGCLGCEGLGFRVFIGLTIVCVCVDKGVLLLVLHWLYAVHGNVCFLHR